MALRCFVKCRHGHTFAVSDNVSASAVESALVDTRVRRCVAETFVGFFALATPQA